MTRTGDAAKESFCAGPRGARSGSPQPLRGSSSEGERAAVARALANPPHSATTSSRPTTRPEFGFDKPFLTVKLAFPEQKPGEIAETPVTRTLVIGGVADGSSRFARLDAERAVFVVGREFLAAAETQP